MKKRSIILTVLLLLVCLAGCGKQEVIPGRPHALEITYGERSIYALTGGYAWNWKEGGKIKTVTTDATDFRAYQSKLPYLNTSDATSMSLDFPIRPDSLTVEVFSADDGFTTGQVVELNDLTLPAPLDGSDHLYTVTAQWEEDHRGWGSCTYHFRFLARALTSATPAATDTGDLELSQILTMDANDFWGIEFTNHTEGAVKTCLSRRDKTALLDFVKDSVPADPTPASSALMETMFSLRMVTLTGSQLTLNFGSDGRNSCLQVGGTAYELEPMNMKPLWSQLQAGSVSAAAAAYGKGYLDVSDTFPLENLKSDFVYATIDSLENGTLTYDEMRQFDDPEGVLDYRWERGWADLTKTVAPDCQFWILENDAPPYCKVTADTLLQQIPAPLTESVMVLFRIYTNNDTVIAICQEPLS